MDITALAHQWLKSALRPGALAVDATVGNGRDTLFLAQHVGAAGLVVGFDIQAAALAIARRHAHEAGVADRLRLYPKSHVHLKEVLDRDINGRKAAAIVFNLGYLPGGDKSITTRTDTTLTALDAACDALAPGGILAIVLYPGHEEGAREAEAVVGWASRLRAPFQSTGCRLLNRSERAPRLIAVERLP